MKQTNKKVTSMKKIVFFIIFLSPLITLFAQITPIEIHQLKWTQDYEALVGLDSKSKNTILGIDSNKNGIRDDVEYYIYTKYEDNSFDRGMFLEAAKKMQTILSFPKNISKYKREKIDQELLKIYTCRDYILYKEDAKNLSKKLREKSTFKSKILNTKERLYKYIDHKKELVSNFDNIKDKDISKERKECLQTYYKYKNIDTKSTQMVLNISK